MKKIAASILSLLMVSQVSVAFQLDELPDQLHVNQNYVSPTISFDINNNNHKKIGFLSRKLYHLTPHYELLDVNGKLLATARSNFYLLNAHFDIYNADEQFLGMVDEDLVSMLPSFELWGPDGHRKLAHATMNIWGTEFKVTDPLTHQQIALMTRPFLRIKNDWTIKITNRALMTQKDINPDLLLTVLAFQSDKEAWKKRRDQDKVYAAKTSLSEAELANLARELEQRFGLDLSDDPEINAKIFKNACLARLKADGVSDAEKQGIRYLFA